MGRIVDGIDLDTGEIVDPNAVKQETSIEEVEENPEREERVRLMACIWPRNMTSFDSDKTGFITDNVMNWHANIKMPVSLKFEFFKKKLAVFPNGSPHNNIQMETSHILEIDKLRQGDVTILQVENGTKKYRNTHSFRKRISELAHEHINSLQHKIYKVIMQSKVDVQVYTRLDPKVLMGESLTEKIIEKKPTHIITSKDEECVVYFYQSVLEEKTVKELTALIK